MLNIPLPRHTSISLDEIIRGSKSRGIEFLPLRLTASIPLSRPPFFYPARCTQFKYNDLPCSRKGTLQFARNSFAHPPVASSSLYIVLLKICSELSCCGSERGEEKAVRRRGTLVAFLAPINIST